MPEPLNKLAGNWQNIILPVSFLTNLILQVKIITTYITNDMEFILFIFPPGG
jgi:hypothetical protein